MLVWKASWKLRHLRGMKFRANVGCNSSIVKHIEPGDFLVTRKKEKKICVWFVLYQSIHTFDFLGHSRHRWTICERFADSPRWIWLVNDEESSSISVLKSKIRVQQVQQLAKSRHGLWFDVMVSWGHTVHLGWFLWQVAFCKSRKLPLGSDKMPLAKQLNKQTHKQFNLQWLSLVRAFVDASHDLHRQLSKWTQVLS